MADKSFFSDKKDKEWAANFWYYYKYRMIFIAVFAAMIAFGAAQCANSVIYDLSVIYYSKAPLSEDDLERLTDKFSGYLDGAAVHIAHSITPHQFLMEMGAGEAYLYITDEDIFTRFADENQFEDISDITGGKAPVYGMPFLMDTEGSPLIASVKVIVKARAGSEMETNRQENAKKVMRKIYEYKY